MGLEKNGKILEKEFFLEEHLLKGRFRNFKQNLIMATFYRPPKLFFYNKLISFIFKKIINILQKFFYYGTFQFPTP